MNEGPVMGMGPGILSTVFQSSLRPQGLGLFRTARMVKRGLADRVWMDEDEQVRRKASWEPLRSVSFKSWSEESSSRLHDHI